MERWYTEYSLADKCTEARESIYFAGLQIYVKDVMILFCASVLYFRSKNLVFQRTLLQRNGFYGGLWNVE